MIYSFTIQNVLRNSFSAWSPQEYRYWTTDSQKHARYVDIIYLSTIDSVLETMKEKTGDISGFTKETTITSEPMLAAISIYQVDTPEVSPLELTMGEGKNPLNFHQSGEKLPALDCGKVLLNSLMPNWYNCTYVLFLVFKENCCKKLTLNLLTHGSPN